MRDATDNDLRQKASAAESGGGVRRQRRRRKGQEMMDIKRQMGGPIREKVMQEEEKERGRE